MADIYTKRRRFKVILLGYDESGKKTMLQHLKQDTTRRGGNHSLLETIYTVQTEKLGTIDLVIHDTGGQERYKSLTTSFFRRAYASIIVFDRSDPEAFVKIKEWHSALLLYRDCLNSNEMFLVATFKEQCEANKSMSRRSSDFAVENSMVYSELNILNSSQVKSFFTVVANHITHQLKETSITASTVCLSDSPEGKERKKCSC